MIYALSWSGGKDAMLALDRAVRQGLDFRYLFNIYEGVSNLVRFHGVRKDLIQAQAKALGRELVQDHTHPEDYPAVLDRILERLRARGVGGIAFGNIHLADIREWYEERTLGRGFVHQEPLWGTGTGAVLDELVARGYRALIVSVNLELGRPEWLGRELDQELVAELKATPEIDLAGERGEYHSFVYDGPLFRQPVEFTPGTVFEREGHRFLDLMRAGGVASR
jgi:uncharacterized protein (TIGR00290 family)